MRQEPKAGTGQEFPPGQYEKGTRGLDGSEGLFGKDGNHVKLKLNIVTSHDLAISVDSVPLCPKNDDPENSLAPKLNVSPSPPQ